MNGSELKRFLFTPRSPGDEPLFATQRALAHAVFELPGSRYASEKSLAVFLSQIFNDKSPCPPDLADGILTVACAKGDLSLEQQARLRELLIPPTDADPVDTLYARQRRSRSVVIVNPDPVEGRGHGRAEAFQEVMLTSLLNGKGAYTFVMDQARPFFAQKFWRQTLLGLERHLGLTESGTTPEDVARRLAGLNDEGRLRVITVPSAACVVPLVAFDPDIPQRCDIYVWDSEPTPDGDFRDAVAKLSVWVRDKWIRDVYEAELVGEHANEQVRFRDVVAV